MSRHEIFTLSEMRGLLPSLASSLPEDDLLLGLLLPLLDVRLDTAGQDFGWHFDRVRAAISMGQADVFFDAYGRLCGFAMWTYAQPAAQRALLADGPRALNASSLGRTGNLWMLEMQASYGSLTGLMQMLRDRHLAGAPAVAYFHHARGRRLAKQLTRLDRTCFARGDRPFQPELRGAFLRTSEGRAMLAQTATALDEGLARGRCLRLLRASPWFSAMPLASALQRLDSPLSLGQCRLHLSDHGEPLALLTWAWLDRECLQLWALRRPETLARYDWNDGDWLCLCDAVATPAGAALLRADLAGDWQPGEVWHLMPGWQAPLDPERAAAQAWSAAQRQALRGPLNADAAPFLLGDLMQMTACA